MKNSPGKKIKTAVFISGKGSNLKSLINFSKKKISNIEIVLVITNNKKAKGLQFAIKNKINNFYINYKIKKISEKKILKKLAELKIKLICLAGFMKILSGDLIKRFNGKIMNIHPSLLPKYKGLNTFSRMLKNRESKAGCTVHYVNNKLDNGKTIVQKSFFINSKDNLYTMKKKTQKLEYRAFPEAIIKIFSYI